MVENYLQLTLKLWVKEIMKLGVKPTLIQICRMQLKLIIVLLQEQPQL